MIRNFKKAYLLLSPSLFWLTLFLVIPVIFIAVISFTTNGDFGGIIYEFSLKAYSSAFSSLYAKVIWQSVWWALIATIVCLFIAYPFAYFIANAGKWKNLLLLLVMVPFWTNLLIRLYAWIILMNNQGVINNVLIDLGFIKEPLALMYSPGGVILGLVYGFLPFMILPIYSSIEQLDKTYLEASEDLGAGPVKTFLNVTLPLTFPGILAGFIITFVPAISVFVVTDLFTGGKLLMVGNVIRDAFLVEMNWQLGAALSLLLMILVLLSLLIFMRFTNRKDRKFLV
ncbi:ABC transporter permease [Ornithinibacillus sp. BX22]|uniref:ABC transporter permease n=2 Tax=Ornithinibacillus TaxID=484508 RepID=A0A923RJE9_9BACI|nr:MULTISPECIES: ABC transporter permease [Ornithinibacillus]MBC5637940.1 ABC transporter permease [Ornithinibacillus hominis]MBS3681696.1 ABC transporter permease [Ornithinibacillus massiliensis]